MKPTSTSPSASISRGCEVDQKILSKIKKCLALAQSDNPNEAATALRQAQALMARHGVTGEAIELSDVESSSVDAGSGKTPPGWIAGLINLVKSAFGVEVVYRASRPLCGEWAAKVEFIGMNGAPEIAGYAYEVLLRQLKKGRADYLKTLNKRLKRTTKVRRGDLYAEGWVDAVRQQVIPHQVCDSDRDLINRWKTTTYNDLAEGKAIDRTSKARQHDGAAYWQGVDDGSKVNFNQGVHADKRDALSHQKGAA